MEGAERIGQPPDLTVGRVRVRVPARGAASSRVVVRLRAERALTDLHGVGGGREIVIVRSADGALQEGAAGRGGLRASLARDLARARESAVAGGDARADAAPAIRFASLEELLLHLALDLIAGRLGSRWYWREVVRALPPPALVSVADLLASVPRRVPQLLLAAEREGVLGPVLDACGERGADRVLRVVLAAYGFGRRAAENADRGGGGAAADGAPATPEGQREERDTGPAREPRWLPMGSEVTAAAPQSATPPRRDPRPGSGERPRRRLLAAVARVLAETPGSEQRVRETLDAAGVRGSGPRPLARASPPPAAPRGSVAPPAGAELGSGTDTDRSTSRAAGYAAGREGWTVPGGAERDIRPATNAIPEKGSRPMDAKSEPVAAAVEMPRTTREGVQTALGGAWLLLAPVRRAVESEGSGASRFVRAHGGWALMTGVMRSLVGRAWPHDPALTRDPVWPLLEELCGPAAAESELPPEVLLPLESELLRVLGTLDPCPLDPLRHLLARPARVEITGTHLDVCFRLRDADLAVRRAGLDLDPGWVPWLGRIILFHYE